MNLYLMKVEELGLGNRVNNALKRRGINYVSDLRECILSGDNWDDSVRCIGAKAKVGILQVMESRGFLEKENTDMSEEELSDSLVKIGIPQSVDEVAKVVCLKSKVPLSEDIICKYLLRVLG